MLVNVHYKITLDPLMSLQLLTLNGALGWWGDANPPLSFIEGVLLDDESMLEVVALLFETFLQL